LAEASTDFESGRLEYAVVGIGINVATDAFPTDIQSTAGSIFSVKPSGIPVTSILVAEILNNMATCSKNFTAKTYLDEYRRRSFLIGQKILVLKTGESIEATAVSIDDEARLIVEYQNKTREVLSFGEVSIRPK
jgi:BirA family biotin operon repressor/biotin-[acetyl-CoA-carboxylase] ligase